MKKNFLLFTAFASMLISCEEDASGDNGGSQPLTISKWGSTTVTIEGNKLSAVPPTSTNNTIAVGIFELNPTATEATFQIDVNEDYTPGSVSYMGKTIAYVSKAGSGEDF